MNHPTLIIFASGSKDGGGSGFENLVQAQLNQEFRGDIVAVVSNHEHGGVRERADRLRIPFVHFPAPYDADSYRRIAEESGAKWVALSGWLKMVRGLDSRRTFNIHPAALSIEDGRFGGPGMYGHHVHEAIEQALERDEVAESGVTMHFVTDEYDRGPIFFEKRIPLRKGMMADEIGKAVNKMEHEYQPLITEMVINGEISWDGENPKSLTVPEGYEWLPKK